MACDGCVSTALCHRGFVALAVFELHNNVMSGVSNLNGEASLLSLQLRPHVSLRLGLGQLSLLLTARWQPWGGLWARHWAIGEGGKVGIMYA